MCVIPTPMCCIVNFYCNNFLLPIQSCTYTAHSHPAIGELGAFAYLDILISVEIMFGSNKLEFSPKKLE